MGIKFNTPEVIKHCAYETLKNGYVKIDDTSGSCTVDNVINYLTKKSLSEQELNTVSDRISLWMQYVKKSKGTYFDDLKSVISQSQTDEKKIGLIASSFSAFDKYIKARESLSDDLNSEYLGEEGDIVTFSIKKFQLIKSGTSNFNKTSSRWWLYKITDENNNVIMLFSNSDYDFELKNSKKITACISKLTEYREVKQTTITKPKFIEE